MGWSVGGAPRQLCISIYTHTHTLQISHGDTLILYVNHVRLSCPNSAAFQAPQPGSSCDSCVCHGNNLQGDMEENTTGMGRHASDGEMMGGVRLRKQKTNLFLEKEKASKSPAWIPAVKLYMNKIVYSEWIKSRSTVRLHLIKKANTTNISNEIWEIWFYKTHVGAASRSHEQWLCALQLHKHRQEAGSTYITQLLFMAHNALHFLNQQHTYTHSTAH